MKLVSWVSFGIFGFIFLAKYGWQKIQASEAFSLTLFLFFLVSFSYSTVPMRTFTLSMMFLLIWVGLRVFIENYSRDEVLGHLKFVLLVYIIASIAIYLFVPELGRQGIWVGSKYIYSGRMTGLAGGANGLGEVACYFSLLCCWDIIRLKPRFGLSFNWIALVLGVIVLFASWNKMGIGAFFVGLAILKYNTNISKINNFKFISLGITTFVLLFIVTWAFGLQSIFEFLSRSGDAGEVLSFTGRSYIWPVVLQSIQQRPMLGSGFGLLSIANESEVVGFVAAHAHNIVLQALSSVGVIGFLLFSLSTILSIHLTIKNKDHLVFVFLVIGIVRGLTESGLFAGTPNMSLFIWLIATFLAAKIPAKSPETYHSKAL